MPQGREWQGQCVDSSLCQQPRRSCYLGEWFRPWGLKHSPPPPWEPTNLKGVRKVDESKCWRTDGEMGTLAGDHINW